MNKQKRVWVMRPEKAGAQLKQALQAAGYEPVGEPAFNIEFLSQEKKENLTAYDVIIFTSVFAVKGYFASEFSLTSNTQVLAVGAATAAALKEKNVDALFPENPGTEGLLALPILQKVAEKNMLIVKGVGGRRQLARTLRQRGADVKIQNTYRRVAQPLETKWTDIAADILVATSAGILQHVEKIVEISSRTLPCIVVSKRLEVIAKHHGWQHVVRAQDASDAAILKALDHYFQH